MYPTCHTHNFKLPNKLANSTQTAQDAARHLDALLRRAAAPHAARAPPAAGEGQPDVNGWGAGQRDFARELTGHHELAGLGAKGRELR